MYSYYMLSLVYTSITTSYTKNGCKSRIIGNASWWHHYLSV